MVRGMMHIRLSAKLVPEEDVSPEEKLKPTLKN